MHLLHNRERESERERERDEAFMFIHTITITSDQTPALEVSNALPLWLFGHNVDTHFHGIGYSSVLKQ